VTGTEDGTHPGRREPERTLGAHARALSRWSLLWSPIIIESLSFVEFVTADDYGCTSEGKGWVDPAQSLPDIQAFAPLAMGAPGFAALWLARGLDWLDAGHLLDAAAWFTAYLWTFVARHWGLLLLLLAIQAVLAALNAPFVFRERRRGLRSMLRAMGLPQAALWSLKAWRSSFLPRSVTTTC
jgi:hypothetical protein